MAVPALVTGQTAAGSTGTAASTSTLTLTLPAPTAKGNCVVAAFAGVSSAAPSYPTGDAVTIGGVTDHFARAASRLGNSANLFIWACPNCQTSSASIVISFSSFAGAAGVIGFAYEFTNVALTSPVDQSFSADSGTTTFTSGATAATTQPNEVWVGIGGGERGGVITATGPGGSWHDQAAQTAQPGSGTPRYGIVSGYQAGALGTAAVTYSGTLSAAVSQTSATGLVLTLLPLAQPGQFFLRQTAINRAAFY